MRAARIIWLVLPTALVVACNEPPTAPTVALSPEAPTTIDNLVATYDGSTDPNAKDTITYRVSWFQNDQRRDDLFGSDTVRFSDTDKGDVWTVSVSASDGDDVGPAGEATVTIANAPPTATVQITPENPATDETIRTTITKKDHDLDPVTVTYEWVVNGSVHANSRQDLAASNTVKGQLWEVRVIPNDGEVDGEPAVVEFAIANTPPEIESARISPLLPDRYSTLECTGVGWFDLDEDDPGYDVQWIVNGEDYSTDATLVARDLERGDSVRCVLTPNDGDDPGEPEQSSEIEIQNTPPKISKVEISPDDPLKNDVVTAVITGAEDLDGDTVDYRYEWKVNGVVAGDTAILPSSRFSKGDIIRLEVFPTDGIGEGTGVVSNTVIGGNNLPEIAGVTLAPEELYTDDVLELSVFASDPDDDRVDVTVEWYVDGVKVSETGTKLDGATEFEKGQEIYAIATPDDGEGEGASVTSDTVTVLNTIPTAPLLVFDPAEPADGEDIQCVVDTDSVDADSEDTLAYTFRWQVNGSGTTSVTTTDETNDTYVGGWTEEDDVVCIVTASDGTATSPEGRYGLAYGSASNPGTSCKDILAERTWYESGVYSIDPDDDGDYSDAYEVYCDMDTDGGGWTLTYYVEADYFDGYYANSSTSSSTPPTELNDQKDIWNVPSDFSYSETMLGCTTQNDAASHYWTYSDKRPYTGWAATRTTTGYVSLGSSKSSTTKAVCYTNYSGASSYYYGFMALERTRCGSCSGILWGAYHYASSTGCNSTSTTYGNHTSKWRSRTITYPVCAGSQTSNGKFWIGLR